MNSGLTIKLISFLLLQDDGLLINNKPAAATFPVGYPCLPPPCWTTMPKCGFDDDDGWANFPPSALPPETKALFGGLQKSQQDEAAQAMTAIAVATATGNVVNTFDENNNENNKEEKEETQGNESNSSSAAPVGNGTKKKKKRTTYTASQKLAILNEIDQKTPLESQETILRKHGISKASVINWRKKREEIEMKSIFEKSDLSTGIEQYTWNEKINWTIKDKNATNTYELKSAITEDPSEKSKRKRKRREAYSIAEKLAILDEIDQNVLSQEFLCKKYGTTRNSVSIWRNNREEYERQVAEDKRGKKRTVLHNDGLRRIKNGLKAFHEFNMTLPSESRLPLSGAIISKRALEIKQLLLADHRERPFLTGNEFKAITTFTGSKGWGRKMAAQFGWKSGPLKINDAAQKEPNESFDQEIQQIQYILAQFDQGTSDGYKSHCLRLRQAMVNVVSQLSAFSKPVDTGGKNDSKNK